VTGAPLSLEIYLQVHTRSRADLDAGKWTAVVGGSYGAHGGGRTFGRFFDLLGEPGMQALTSLAKLEEGLMPEAIFAELSYQPWQARLANVAIRPPLRDYEIAIGTTPSVPPDHVLPLSDLVVGVRAGRFYLRSLHLNKQVYVCQNHLLNPRLAPNVCRFLSEISQDALPALSSFDWGPLNISPFLPRLVVNLTSSSRLVLAVACWQLNADMITPIGTGSFEARWFRGLQAWRREWNVPRYVYLTEYDNRLLLDLEHSLMAAELYNVLKKQKGESRIVLEEMLPDFEHLWLRDERNAGYLAEIVVPLLRTDAVEPAARSAVQERKASFPVQVISAVERNYYPGEAWTYIKWYAAPTQHEQLIAGPMREIVTRLETHGLIDRWFFIRYADPEPHLRLRFHARDMQNNDVLISSVLSWSLHLARRDLIRSYMLDTYEREVERYGGPNAMDLLEQVFTTDSAIVSTIVANQYARRLTLDPLTIAVCTLDHGMACWGLDMPKRHGWLTTKVEKYAFGKEFHTKRKAYCDLLTRQSPPDQAEQGKLLYDLLDQQVESLGKLGKEVGQLAEAGKLWVSEDELLSSLAHMHLNRLLGIDPNRERKSYAFWHHTLDALLLKPS
jgi:thiopeptide-type bacteriocin biosynthesis protein